MKGTSEEVLNGWFNTFQQILQEYNIKENIYNMDESRLSIVINAQIRQKYQAQLGQQEWVSVVECIYTAGSTIALIIFKGENLSTQWIPANIHKD